LLVPIKKIYEELAALPKYRGQECPPEGEN
jgi:hypothetical protein